MGSRHLGLVLPEEIAGLREQMNRLGKCLEETIDWEFLEELGAEKEERDALEEENTEASCTAASASVWELPWTRHSAFIIRIICGF